MRKLGLGLLVSSIVAGGVITVAACGASDETSSPPPIRGGDAATPGAEAGFADGGAPPLIDVNGIVLVHAASFPAFRVCFDGASTEPPTPSADLLPESNVVGVEVGAAVRLPPHGGILGRAYVFPELGLRQYYPNGVGPSCAQLLNATGEAAAVDVGTVDTDLTRGVHLLVLGGCLGTAKDPVASKERCGEDWDATKGNLSLSTISLKAYARQGDSRLPVQLMQLSRALDRRAAGRALGIAFGSLDGGTEPRPFVEGAVPFGEVFPSSPAILDYAASDNGSYATSGVFVTLGPDLDDAGLPIEAEGGADGGADASSGREVLFTQSLADLQKRSAPRSLPMDWFAVRSSYLLLSLGDTDPRLGDGGVDDDPRRALHLLAIPLADPATNDAGPPPL